MTKPTNVRLARPDEGDVLYALLMGLHEENGQAPLDPVKTRVEIENMLDPKIGIIGVIDGPDGLEGAVGMILTSWWYTSRPHLSEVFNYVRPDRRKSTHAKHLIEFAKWCADDLGIRLYMGIVTTERTEAKERLYRRQLAHIGGYFMHEPAKD